MSNSIIQFAKVILIGTTITLTQTSQVVARDLPEGILATVNERPISQMSVDNVASQITESGQEADPKRILDELVNLEVLTQAAEELNLDKEPEISAALQLQYTQTMANAYLARKGADMSFTEEELRAEYDAQSANVDRDEFKASHILLETAAEAEEVIAELEDGKAFPEAAAEHSIDPAGENGGELGWFVAATMDPEFASAVSSMEEGDFSKTPVKTSFGYHVILLEEKRSAALPEFNSVKTGLTNLAVRRALAQHVEELKAAANIQQ